MDGQTLTVDGVMEEAEKRVPTIAACLLNISNSCHPSEAFHSTEETLFLILEWWSMGYRHTEKISSVQKLFLKTDQSLSHY